MTRLKLNKQTFTFSPMDHETLHLATTLGQLLKAAGATLTVAESCTGGGLGAAITAVPGSSAWFENGFITYSNAAKQRWLGVDARLLEEFGAVSAEVVDAMAGGALKATGADYAVAVSGIAGPGGGSAEKPVGTVWIGCRSGGAAAEHQRFQFAGDRASVRHQAVLQALRSLIQRVQEDLGYRTD